MLSGPVDAVLGSRFSKLLQRVVGKPSHPPLTDVSIGAYTVGVTMLILGALGLEEAQMAHGALLAFSGGLVLRLPAALTGLLDWLKRPRRTQAWVVGTIHLIVMLSATVLFAVTWLLQRPGYGTVKASVWILGLAAEAVLIGGGYLGGSLVFVYGTRVLGRRETPVADALIPGRAGRTGS